MQIEKLKKLRLEMQIRLENSHKEMVRNVWDADKYDAPASLHYFIKSMLDLLTAYENLLANHNRTRDLFDALGIWTGADDLLWDRLLALLEGVNYIVGDEKREEIKPFVDRVKATWGK